MKKEREEWRTRWFSTHALTYSHTHIQRHATGMVELGDIRFKVMLCLSQHFEFAAWKMVKEHFAAVTERSLQRVFNFWKGKPNFARTDFVEVAMKPLAPTSIVNSSIFQSVSREILSASGVYLLTFLIAAVCIPSSAGQVSSIIYAWWRVNDQITMSGLSLVA